MLIGLTSFMMVACDPDPEDPKLEVSTNEITLDAEGETQSFTIDSNVSWTITGNKSWLSVSPTMGKKDATVVLTAQQNTNVENRECQLNIMSADGGVSQTVKVVQNGAEGELRVNGSTSASLSFGADGGEKQQINITANSDWTITSIPDWIRVSPVNGSKNSTITLTVETENFSDEDREATLVIEGNGISANLNVNQVAKLAKNCRVELSNLVISYDGFAADLTFGSEAKGYREAFLYAEALADMTDRDIYNLLMQRVEFSGTVDYTYWPGKANPGTELVYCIAAYGNENYSDGSHKYGPLQMIKLKTKERTLECDMYLTISSTSTEWNVNAEKKGSYGQRCGDYYIYGWEGFWAEYMYEKYNDDKVCSAFFMYAEFLPTIEEDPDFGYKSAPQVMTYVRSSDSFSFFCLSWGRHNETKEYSAELSEAHKFLQSEEEYSNKLYSPSLNSNRKVDNDKPHRIFSRSEIEEIRNNMKVYKVQM